MCSGGGNLIVGGRKGLLSLGCILDIQPDMPRRQLSLEVLVQGKNLDHH